VARYKPIPSKQEEFDAFWDDLMTECGCNEQERAEIVRQSDEFQIKSARLKAICQLEANSGRQEGQPLEDFKKAKLRSLDLIAQTVNELSE
jgi:hypothetical protein